MTALTPEVQALGSFVPEPVARKLCASGGRLEAVEAKATVLLCDIAAFTELTESLGPRRVFEFLNAYFGALSDIIDRHGGMVTQFQGDAVLAVYNVPVPNSDHGASALRSAIEMVQAADRHAF